MSYFEQILSGLFPDEKNKGPLIHELLSRSDNFRLDYCTWKSHDKNFILGKIWKAYGYKRANLGTAEMKVHILNSSQSNGFAVVFDSLLTSKLEFQFLMEYFKDQVLNLGYKTVNADRRIIEKEKHLESTERYYLKPTQKEDTPPFSQNYGNIIIEHILNNDSSSHLKLTVNSYSDRNYKDPLPFTNLFENLLHLK